MCPIKNSSIIPTKQKFHAILLFVVHQYNLYRDYIQRVLNFSKKKKKNFPTKYIISSLYLKFLVGSNHDSPLNEN